MNILIYNESKVTDSINTKMQFYCRISKNRQHRARTGGKYKLSKGVSGATPTPEKIECPETLNYLFVLFCVRSPQVINK